MDGRVRDAALIRVLIVDDHTTFTDLLTGALDRESDLLCVGSAAGVKDGVSQFKALLPDVVLMDFHLSDGDGLEAARQILALDRRARVVMLTGDPTEDALQRSAEIGICAFLPKDGSLATVLDSLRHARPGAMVVPPALLSQLARRRAPQPPSSVTLTGRELSVLRLMADGNDVRTNARILGISESTCRGHVKAILAKLDAHSQLEAVAIANRLGLLGGRGNA